MVVKKSLTTMPSFRSCIYMSSLSQEASQQPFFAVVQQGIEKQPFNIQLLIPMFKCLSSFVYIYSHVVQVNRLNTNSRIDTTSDCPVILYLRLIEIMSKYVTTVLHQLQQNVYYSL